MNEKDLNAQRPTIVRVLKPRVDIEIVKGKYWGVKKANWYDLPQWNRAAKALNIAGMTFEELYKAGKFLGNEVEIGEVDAPIQEGWQNGTGEIIQDQHRVLGWQNRGEKVTVGRQLSFGSGSGTEVIEISDYLPSTQNTTEQTINVIEGINIVSERPLSLSDVNDQERENSPFLKTSAEIKKAA